MMRLIESLGIPIFYQSRHADEHNPNGYYETPAIMARLARGEDISPILEKLAGRVIKLPLPHAIKRLPTGREYLIVWLDRDPILSAASLRKMNLSKGAATQPPVERMAEGIRLLRQDALAYMSANPEHFKILRVDQNVIDQSGEAVGSFLMPLKNAGITPTEEINKILLPKFGRQLRTAAAAAGRFIRHGAPTTPPDILAAREATCRACPEWDAAALNGTGRCRKCGCSTWAKLRMATESCPLGKWEALPAAQ